MVKQVEASHRPFASHVADMVDLVGYHELGHLFIAESGINPHARWFNEMLATYAGYAFMSGYQPELARTWEIVSRSDAESMPAHRSLADFERLYSGVGAENYVWYQGRFSERVFAVFAGEGSAFLRKVAAALPREPDVRLAADQLLERLEKIQPGFQAWAVSRERNP